MFGGKLQLVFCRVKVVQLDVTNEEQVKKAFEIIQQATENNGKLTVCDNICLGSFYLFPHCISALSDLYIAEVFLVI